MTVSLMSELESSLMNFLDQTPFQFDRGVIKGEVDERGGGGRLFERGHYFKYFRLRWAIIREGD